MKTFWPDFAPLRIFSKMFLTTEIAQIVPAGLFRSTLQSEKKNILGREKKSVIPYFQVKFTSTTTIYENYVNPYFFLLFPIKVSEFSKNEACGREKLFFRPHCRHWRICPSLTLRFSRKTYFSY